MTYQRINFKDQVVERPKTYDITNNPDGSITLIDNFGNVEELGTPINSVTMGHIEDALEEQDGRITTLENSADYTNFVKKSGDTMTGTLTVKMSNNSTLSVQSSSLAYSEIPTANAGYGHFAILDKNGEWGALYGLEKFTDGKNVAKMQVKGVDGTYARISVGKRSDGSAYFDFPKCSTKATTTSSAKNDLVTVVVQNYVNGYAWMRKWSDGWIEQGGRKTVSYEQIVTTNFVTSFSNTDYYVTASPINWQNIDDNIHVVSLTTSSCGLYGTGIGNAGNWNTVVAVWYACGY